MFKSKYQNVQYICVCVCLNMTCSLVRQYVDLIMYICLYVYPHTHRCVCTCVYMYVRVYMYVYLCISTYVRLCVRMFVCSPYLRRPLRYRSQSACPLQLWNSPTYLKEYYKNTNKQRSELINITMNKCQNK